jgi:hypothetical protein
MGNPYAPAAVDFSSLAQLPQLYEQGQQSARERALRNAFAGGLPMNGGVPDYASMAQTFAANGKPDIAVQLLEQAGGKNSFTRTGTDDAGNPNYGWVNSTTQTVTPYGQHSTQQPTANGAPVTGEDYLATLPGPRASLIRSIARGDQAVPAYSRGGRQLLEQVNQYDPTYSQSIAPSRTATRKAFAIGKQGDAVTALNTLPGHVKNLNSSIDAVNGFNTGMGAVDRWLNSGRNYFEQGGSSPTGQALNQFHTM